jgi:hypothetical protein
MLFMSQALLFPSNEPFCATDTPANMQERNAGISGHAAQNEEYRTNTGNR